MTIQDDSEKPQRGRKLRRSKDNNGSSQKTRHPKESGHTADGRGEATPHRVAHQQGQPHPTLQQQQMGYVSVAIEEPDGELGQTEIKCTAPIAKLEE